MAKPNEQDVIARKVMQDIADGRVTMRPRPYYAALSAMTVATSIVAGLVVAYLFSMAYFWLRIVTADTQAYGARMRLSEAMANFPWWLLVLAGLLAAASVILVRRQGRLYRHRWITVALLLVVASLLLGVVFASLNIGKPYAQQHTPRMQQRGQGWRHTQQ